MRENSATVPTDLIRATEPPLPYGAGWDGEWVPDPPFQPYRIVHGPKRSIGEAVHHFDGYTTGLAEVETSACQNFDGTLASDDPPQIHVHVYRDSGINPSQAREVAALLLEAADEVDGWVGK